MLGNSIWLNICWVHTKYQALWQVLAIIANSLPFWSSWLRLEMLLRNWGKRDCRKNWAQYHSSPSFREHLTCEKNRSTKGLGHRTFHLYWVSCLSLLLNSGLVDRAWDVESKTLGSRDFPGCPVATRNAGVPGFDPWVRDLESTCCNLKMLHATT